MAQFSHSVGSQTYRFDSLKDVMAKASPARSGDFLAGVAALNDGERVAAQMTLADIPLKHFLEEVLIPYETDEVTRLIIDSHDKQAFATVSHLTVGGFRDWLLSDAADEQSLRALAPGLIPEMAAAVSKIMRVQDLILVAQKIRVVTQFRGTLGQNLMYFETGQGSALSANAHFGVDQQTCETRAYAVARHFKPFLVNTVVGFIGPEYLYNGKQIIRAGLEDHFCGKLLGVPMGCDICYTNHAEADQDDMDTLLTLLGVAGINFIMGIPGSDDIMLNYQTTSFHDALYARQTLGLKPAPEFEQWLARTGIFTQADGKVHFGNNLPPAFRQALAQLG